ncbi:hypothetical protein MHBO_000210 [Bonamia ostreae]|uniref:Uncharacterized protein n=1 Tax=Bonamia ostreae TaxID=126728 RepID=A0ABV2AES8_9EUKA
MYPGIYDNEQITSTIIITRCNFGQVLGTAIIGSLCKKNSVSIVKDSDLFDITLMHEVFLYT